jgi:hypothetical protein
MGILWECVGNETERFVVEKSVGMRLGMKMGMKMGLRLSGKMEIKLSAHLISGMKKNLDRFLVASINWIVKIFKIYVIVSYNWLKSERENSLKSAKIMGLRAKVRGLVGPYLELFWG